MTADRRAPTPAHLTKRRLPPRSSRQTTGLDHSHIRLVPHRGRGDGEALDDEYDDGVPTFRSPSLQFATPIPSLARLHDESTPVPSLTRLHDESTPIPSLTRLHDESTAQPLAHATTFADMARRYHQRGDAVGSEPSSSSPGPLGGIVKLQPHRKTWRPMRASELSQCENAANDANESSLAAHAAAYPARDAGCTPVDAAMPMRPSLHSQIQSMLDHGAATFRASTVSFGATGDEHLPAPLYGMPGHNGERLFGKLPDPIRLHEQTGDFDGQVVFIGHPNRDVSAHQWSSTSFQWVNIGRYAHVRGKVEGSLASDCLRDYDASQHPVEFFKCAAENRERLVVEKGRQDATTQSRASALAYAGERATMLPTDSGPSTPGSSQNTITRELLEDPFVAHARSLIVGPASLERPKASKARINGSLDFKYEFPFRASASAQPGRVKADYRGSNLPDRLLQPSLFEVCFGEDAASSTRTTTGRFFSQRQPSNYAPLHVVEHRVLEEEPARLDLPASYARTSTGGRTATSTVPDSFATARSLFPASGLTVANPRRAVLDAVDPGSSQSRMHAAASDSEASDSQATTVDPITVALKFSDPDGLRQSQDYEIANGLSKQAPTVQNLKGPFFTDTKPTTTDPAAQLSVPIDEEEKLSTWFHDGHRPARQQAYARSLMSTALSYGRVRNLGAIGETMDSKPVAKYENTPAFVRLYEHLSEYVDEQRNGSGSSYFTRAWNPLSRDPGVNGSSNYPGKSVPVSVKVEAVGGYQAARYANRGRGGA